jgi:hypothetical protein
VPSILEEPLVPHVGDPATVPLATQVRGTVILSSLKGLRSRGYGPRYMELLDRRHHEDVASLTALTWLPITFAAAHYDACDRLGLDRATIESLGLETGKFVKETVLRAVSRIATESGVTPWFVLSNADKLVGRNWIGSSIAVWKLGPKEARIEWIQQPLARFGYFRLAFGGVIHALLDRFARTVVVREVPRVAQDREVCHRLSWV